MYNVKVLIEKMKQMAKLKTNTDLAKELDVSYNTLNTWLKREKLPQEIILNFANKYSASLDFLLLESSIHKKQEGDLFNSTFTQNKQNTTKELNNCTNTFIFYGDYEPLNIKPGATLELNSTLLHSDGHYLLKYDDIYFIAKVILDAYSNKATIITCNNSQKNIESTSFKSHKIGIITGIK